MSFAATAAVVQTVTENHQDLVAAVNRFELQRGTATGSGLTLALAQLLPDAGIDVDATTYNYGFSSYAPYGEAAPIERSRKAAKSKDFTPVAVGSFSGGGIVLLSDGRRTTGPDPLEAARLAADHGVRVLYACESGSRGWGFASPDSDYDVRFIFVRTAREYLRITPVRDVIEEVPGPVFDVNGWDLRKALQLLAKGNATLIEWPAEFFGKIFWPHEHQQVPFFVPFGERDEFEVPPAEQRRLPPHFIPLAGIQLRQSGDGVSGRNLRCKFFEQSARDAIPPVRDFQAQALGACQSADSQVVIAQPAGREGNETHSLSRKKKRQSKGRCAWRPSRSIQRRRTNCAPVPRSAGFSPARLRASPSGCARYAAARY